MHRLRQSLASYTITPVGIILLAVLAVAIGLFAFGPSDTQALAMIVGVILILGTVGGLRPGVGGGGSRMGWGLTAGRLDRGPIERPAEPHPPDPEVISATVDPQAEAELWRKERERYAQEQRPR